MLRVFVGLALLAAGVCAGTSASTAPLEAYGRLPSIELAAISPDGSLIAVALTDGEHRSITVIRARDKSAVVTLKAGDSKIRDVTWAGSSHILITSSVTGAPEDVITPRGEWSLVFDYNLKTGVLRNVLEGTGNTLAAADALPQARLIDGAPYAFVPADYFVDGAGRTSLFKIDLDHDKTTLDSIGWRNTQSWVIGADGHALAETEFDARSRHWAISVKEAGNWRQALTLTTDYAFDGDVGLGRDGQSVVMSIEKDGRTAFHELDPAAGKWGDPFAVMDNADTISDPATGALIGLHALVGDAAAYQFFAPADQAAWNAAVKAFPGQRVTLQSLSADHRKLLVLVDSPVDGQAYALVDLAAHSAYYIGTTYDGLGPNDLGPVRPIAFKASDGLPLTGYLTLPPGREAKGLPLIVFPHGGPAARDEPGFDWWAQGMASRGYAVLQVNYRGSSGFDWDLLKAGFGEWGRKMQTDLSDGMRYLAAQGTIDPRRVCIVGGSYGGYAALAGAAFEPDVYRCAVSIAGVSELHRFVFWTTTQSDISVQRYWDRFMGAKSSSDPHLEDISPADHADRIAGAVLLIHGRDDTVVPFAQSELMADALKKAGKPYEFVILNHEDHWLSRGDTRLQMLRATMDFLEKNNPPG